MPALGAPSRSRFRQLRWKIGRGDVTGALTVDGAWIPTGGVACGKNPAVNSEKSYMKHKLSGIKLFGAGFLLRDQRVTNALDTFVLRLPEDLHLRLRRAAEMNRRSLNSEIVARMERALTSMSAGELDDGSKFALIRKVIVLENTLEQIKMNAGSD